VFEGSRDAGDGSGVGVDSCVVEIRLPSTADELREPLLPEA
jgi:hypothetical protein